MNTQLAAPSPMDRRSFLKLSALAGGGLLLGCYFKGGSLQAAEVGKPTAETLREFAPNPFVRISPNGVVTIIAHKPELGQGISTALPMIVAEELDVEWSSVRVEGAMYDPVAYGNQRAGGSMSTPTSYTPMRQMGATARAILVAAAAETWGVPVADCTTSGGFVLHAASNRKASYGSLVAKAVTLPMPAAASVPLKNPRDFKLVGTRVTGHANADIVTGKPLFGIDQKVPGMLYAVYEKCPVFGGKVVSANLDEIKAQPGVKHAFVLEGTSNLMGLMPGVAIVADSTWSAFSARRQLKVKWDEGPYAGDSTAGFEKKAAEIGARSDGGSVVRNTGDVPTALAGAAKVVEAAYSYPFISHATLEPQNTLAHFQDGRIELWSPTRAPSDGATLISSTLGIPAEKIKIHITRSGGAFGRRAAADFMVEAAAISQKISAPVKLTWNREDDLRHDHYRPAGHHFFKAGLDASGKLVAWQNHFVSYGNKVTGKDGKPTLAPAVGGTLDGAQFPAAAVPNYRTVQSLIECAVPTGSWRAPGNNAYAYVMQGFVDELAVAAGRDPLQFRLDLLAATPMPKATTAPDGGPSTELNPQRAAALLRLVAEKAGWGKKFPAGQGAGIAFHFCHLGYAAHVVEVTVSAGGAVRVDRVVTALDVGRQIVNLSGAENQVQGSIIDALSAAMNQQCTLEHGRMAEGNFDDYALLRMPAAPKKIEIHYLRSDYHPTGIGEPPLPPLAPAVANAIFAATGRRLRQMPWSRAGLSWA
jgi:isoquinoline 1-oxidoreductase beta subunit